VTTSNLKKLVIQAKQFLNEQLTLKREKVLAYEDTQYFGLLTCMSVWGSAAEQTSTLLDGSPSGDALLQQLKKFTFDDVHEQFDKMFVKQLKKAHHGRKRPKVVAIIDVHEQETYTKQKRTSPDVRGGKHKNGTNFFFHFVTLQVLWNEHVVTLRARLHQRDTALRDIVTRLVKEAQQHVRIDTLLLDRGFREVTLLNELAFLGVPILMPATMDKKAKKTLATFGKRQRSCRYSLHNNHNEHADVRLLKIMLPDGKTIGFYTTKYAFWHPPTHFLRLYKKRWTIETGYRVQNQLLAKTTCIVGSVRLFYFSYAIALHNLWLWLRHTTKKLCTFTVMTLRVMLGSLPCGIHIAAPD